MQKRAPVLLYKLNKEKLKKAVLDERKKEQIKLPLYVDKDFYIDEIKEHNCICYRLRPKTDFSGTYIVYFYGSGMCKRICDEQWKFIINTAKAIGAGLFVPMYPLTPEHTCHELFDMLEPAYANFSRGNDIEKLILIGDEAGAGLALSISMLAWKNGFRKPDQLILISPSVDTEFFDKDLERKAMAVSLKKKNIMFNEAVKDFINTYWVADYGVKTEYTSPYYGDYTDLCNDVIVFSGVNDTFSCYAQALYNKAKNQGVSIRFFEFIDDCENFMIYSNSIEQKRAYNYLLDVLGQTYNNSLLNIYPLKLLSDWSRKYPDTIKDEWAVKFIYDNKFNFSGIDTNISEYKNIQMASMLNACDTKVKSFIQKYPEATIINIGCRLDNMFDRVDNGRIEWYSIDSQNMMSVRRAIYGVREREKTIGRRLSDFLWLDNIVCDRAKGVLFVCNDEFSYLGRNYLRNLFGQIRSRFPGCEMVFTISTKGANLFSNLAYKDTVLRRKKRIFYINDAHKTFGNWNIEYRVVSEEPVMRYFVREQKYKIRTNIGIIYNLITYNHKLVHLKLGSEEYKVKFSWR